MTSEIHYIEQPQILQLTPINTIPLHGPLLENRKLVFDGPFVGVQRAWEPDSSKARHGLTLTGIEVCYCVEPCPFGRGSHTQLMMIRPVLFNTSPDGVYLPQYVFAQGYEETKGGKADLSRCFEIEWSPSGTCQWLEPGAGIVQGRPEFFKANTKSIQFVGLTVLTKRTIVRDGKEYSAVPQDQVVPFEYILHRNSAYGAKPDWSLFNVATAG